MAALSQGPRSWLDDSLTWCREVSIDEIVCLVDGVEIAEKSPEYGAALGAGTFHIPVEQFPIPDYGMGAGQKSSIRPQGVTSRSERSGS